MRRVAIALTFFAACLAAGQSTASWKVRPNLVYSKVSGQTLDLYLPTRPLRTPMPALVFVHGGGWVSGEKEDYTGWCQLFATLGYACITINYRLAPTYVWPAQVDDTQASVRWLRKNATAFGIDPSAIGAVGLSAGGHLVNFLGSTDTLHDFDPGLSGYSSKVEAVGDYFGPTDFTVGEQGLPTIWVYIADMLGANCQLQLGVLAAASPVAYVTPADAPEMIFQGIADPLVPYTQSTELADLKHRLGDACTLELFPGQGHGFDWPTTYHTILELVAFFAKVLAAR